MRRVHQAIGTAALIVVVVTGCETIRPSGSQIEKIDKGIGIASLTLATSYDTLTGLLQANAITTADARTVLAVLNQVDVGLRAARHYVSLGDVPKAQGSLDRANSYLSTAQRLTVTLQATPTPGR